MTSWPTAATSSGDSKALTSANSVLVSLAVEPLSNVAAPVKVVSMLSMLSVLNSVFAPLIRFSMSARADEDIVMPVEVVDWAKVTVEVRKGRKMKKLSSRSRNMLSYSFVFEDYCDETGEDQIRAYAINGKK